MRCFEPGGGWGGKCMGWGEMRWDLGTFCGRKTEGRGEGCWRGDGEVESCAAPISRDRCAEWGFWLSRTLPGTRDLFCARDGRGVVHRNPSAHHPSRSLNLSVYTPL